MGSMEEFIHYANLTHFKRQLADPSVTNEERRMLTRLLAQEEAKEFGEPAPAQ
jgi:hypothetical protein